MDSFGVRTCLVSEVTTETIFVISLWYLYYRFLFILGVE